MCVGSGGAKLKMDGDKFGNMMGHSNGAMDYVWTQSTGQMTLFPSNGYSTLPSADTSWWGTSSVIFDPPALVGKNLDRRDLHLVDWDGDGATDIVWVDPGNQNRVQLWRNRIKETGSFNWAYNSNPAPSLSCAQSRGVGIFDLAVRFADITGSGRPDYLCIEKNGRVSGSTQDASGTWTSHTQIKVETFMDRANLQVSYQTFLGYR